MILDTPRTQPAVMPRQAGHGNRGRAETRRAEIPGGRAPLTRVMLERTIRMTQQVLKASAALILLFRDDDQELYYETASQPVGRTLRQINLNAQYGIAGQVARTGKPLIVNNAGRCEKFHKLIDDITGHTTQALVCAPLTVNHRILGVIEVLNKLDGTDFNEQDMDEVVAVAEAAAMAIENTRQHQGLREAYRDTIAAVAAAVNDRDAATRGHAQRVAEYALLAGGNLSLGPGEMETLEYASLLHDIGKLAIDTAVLRKPQPLAPQDEALLRQHPVAGAKMLRGIAPLEAAADLIRYHHEAYDGSGYPEGLQGEAIPLGARLIAVADAFDILTTDGSDRPALKTKDAIRRLQDGANHQFCPVAVRSLIGGLSMYFHR